jgi:hypothetical protein
MNFKESNFRVRFPSPAPISTPIFRAFLANQRLTEVALTPLSPFDPLSEGHDWQILANDPSAGPEIPLFDVFISTRIFRAHLKTISNPAPEEMFVGRPEA